MSHHRKPPVRRLTILFPLCLLLTVGCVSGQAAPASATASAASAAGPSDTDCERLAGEWVNELDSVLAIDSIDSTSGRIEGRYISSTSTDGRTFPMIGWSNDREPEAEGHHARVVTFTVHWGDYGSLTAWTGYCFADDGRPTLRTNWNLVRPNSEFRWDHIHSDSSVFVPRSQ
ncbi:MAG: avidin/streptavidin family protein [Acidobacteriota bacterium]